MKRFAAFIGGVIASSAFAQTLSSDAQKHLDAAAKAAGVEHQAIHKTVCDGAIAFANPPAPRLTARTGAPSGPPARSEWYAEPQKVFDNLYYVGMTEYSVWALTTSQGIILLDAIFDYSIEAEVDEGLRKLGLNPADIKYVIVSHGHGDHAGGAKYLQDKYGAHILMSAADYDMPALKTRKPGDPHPYVVGLDSVQRFITTVGECAKAAVDITAKT